MRRFVPLFVGFSIGFAIVAAAVAAGVFFVIGVGGHLLARSDDAAATTISFDPSTVAARSPIPAAVAVILLVGFIAIYVRLRRAEKRFDRDVRGRMRTPGQYPGVDRRQSDGRGER